MSTPSERLQELMKLLRIKSINAFALSIGLNQSVLNNIVAGRQSKPSFDTLEKIKLKYPRVNLDWLVTGDGDPLRPSSVTAVQGEQVLQLTTTGHNFNQTSGGTFTFTTVEECEKELTNCRATVVALQSMVNDKQMIIDLLQKTK